MNESNNQIVKNRVVIEVVDTIKDNIVMNNKNNVITPVMVDILWKT